MFCPGSIGDSAGSEVTQQLMGAETSGLEIVHIPGGPNHKKLTIQITALLISKYTTVYMFKK